MRDLKFRALYDDMGGGWKYGMLIYEGGVPRIQQEGTMLFSTCLKGTEGQFTGLVDKNGVEIYEGDIVTFWGGRGKVIYFDVYAAFKIQFQTENDLADLNLNSHEVLGNIYENAELIKV